MLRPCFVVVDREHSGTISTRKLVIETGKFNVITAYSGEEALETVRAYPAVNGIVLDAGIEDIPCAELVRRLKEIQPKLAVIVVGGPGQESCAGQDYFLHSFSPALLLDLLRSLMPSETAAISRRDEDLAD